MKQTAHYTRTNALKVLNAPTDAYVNPGKNPKVFRVGYDFINHTGTDITLSLRSGLKINVPDRGKDIDERILIIREEYSVPRQVISSVTDSFIAMDDNCTQKEHAFFVLREQHKYNQELSSCIQEYKYIIEYRYHHDALFKSGNGFAFLGEVDVVVSDLPPKKAPDHPLKDSSMFGHRYDQIINSVKGVGFVLEMVDNESTYGPRFVRFGDSVYKIKPIRDENRASGVYYGHFDNGDYNTKIFKVEECETIFGMYTTEEEALAGGDVEGKIKADIKRYEREMLEAKQQHDQIVRAAELEKTKLLTELETQKAVNIRTDAELKRLQSIRNDLYEVRSHERKDYTEFVKFAGAVLVSCLTTWAVLSKKKD